jgi:hypothetical protein
MINIKFEPIVPRDPKLIINVARLEKELVSALDRTTRIIKRDFQSTVRTWSTQPFFERKGARKIFGTLKQTVKTDDKIYFFVDQGTTRHWVGPRSAKALRFQSGYKAKTRLGVIGSRAGGAFGPFVGSKGHWVKGIAARKFAKTIAKRRQRLLRREVATAFSRSFRFGGVR